MPPIVDMLIEYGYLLIVVFVVLDQIGLPVPAVPILLAAGALAGTGRLNPLILLTLAVTAAILSDLVRYQIGRRWGGKVLGWICRISLEPDTCVRRAENGFARHGLRALLIAKFLPGLNAAAPVLAGVFKMKLGPFLLLDAAGALIWAGLFIGLGHLFSDQLGRLVATISRAGLSALSVMAGGLGGYLAWKYLQRRRFLKEMRFARITPDELHRKLETGEETVVVDLRHPIEFETDPRTVPGAIRLPFSSLNDRVQEIPADREVVLLCN